MSDPMFHIGIDLGTTHTVLAWSSIEAANQGRRVTPQVFDVPQHVAAGEVRSLPLLPSFIYLPGSHELLAGATALPWGDPGYLVGSLARDQGSRVPGRLVSSAKSWLSYAAAERTGAILPWGAASDVSRISPVEATARILGHARAAWNHGHPAAPLEDQDLVITVPASFDEVARELTVRAAQQAGLPRFVLLEEPQAALYDWLSAAGGTKGLDISQLDQALGRVRRVLIVDVGGGTTDLTLVDCGPAGARKLTRVAVGEHLMLGGDNMDLALAHFLEPRLSSSRLDAGQWSMLIQAARSAKERLLAPGAPASARVTVVGRGSRLVGGSLSTDLAREEAESQLLDGFFPRVSGDPADPTGPKLLGAPAAGHAALQELGLPFASDPAVTRHILHFLHRHASDGADGATSAGAATMDLPRPDALLLNGGVFNSPRIQARLLEVVSGWWPNEPSVPLLRELQDRPQSLDLAVARGAAAYARVRKGDGVRIGGGSARTYLVKLPGDGQPTGLCLVPRGQEEGQEVPLPERTFALTLGTPVRFDVFSSTTQHLRAGEVGPLGDAEALPPIETVLASAQGRQGRTEVRLVSRLTEIGTLEVFCEELRASGQTLRWKLEFSLRGSSRSEAGATRVDPLPSRFQEGRDLIERVYGKRPLPVTPRDVKDLLRNLEKSLGPRDGWSSAVCRELWSELHAGTPRRRRSADHERLWCQLSGFGLRPGLGHPLDAWRVGETWKIFEAGLQFHTEKANWSEWWILWRRISPGLDSAAHAALWSAVSAYLEPGDAVRPARAKGIRPEGADEMLRLAACLEQVPLSSKEELAQMLLRRIQEGGAGNLPAWCLGRLGSRRPVAGPHTAVPPDRAEAWLERLFAFDWAKIDGIGFAAVQIARKTDDRSRDVDPGCAKQVEAKLIQLNAPQEWIHALREATDLGTAEQTRVFGEALPAGLSLIG